MRAVIEAQYFPCLEYFSFLKSQKEIWIETKEHFVKQTYRNRCYIQSANKVLPLTIPIKNGSKKIPIEEVELDYTHKWLSDHWHSITSAYNKSPFFEFYEEDIRAILFARHTKLLDLNLAILTFCLKVLQIDIELNLTASYEDQSERSFHDMRSVIHPKKAYIYRKIYSPVSYQQIFGNIFVPNLSVLDLLSCAGPSSSTYL